MKWNVELPDKEGNSQTQVKQRMEEQIKTESVKHH